MAHAIEPGFSPEEAVALGAAAGWTWTKRDLARILALAPGGAFAARDASGRAVGIVTVVSWGDLAWIGDHVVHPDARGQGLGAALLDRALAHAESTGARVVGTDAPPEAAAVYTARGFIETGRSAMWTREGHVRAPSVPSGEYALYPVSSCEIMELHDYDRPRFGASRARLLAALISEEPHRSFVAVHRKTGAFSGHALAMDDRIGPLVADAPEAAAWLLHACGKVGVPARAIVPAWTPGAEELFRAAGYAPGRQCVRLARGGPLPQRAGASYALGGWALG